MLHQEWMDIEVTSLIKILYLTFTEINLHYFKFNRKNMSNYLEEIIECKIFLKLHLIDMHNLFLDILHINIYLLLLIMIYGLYIQNIIYLQSGLNVLKIIFFF